MLTSSSQIILSVSVLMMYELRQNIFKRHTKQTSVIMSENMLTFCNYDDGYVRVRSGGGNFLNTKPVAQPIFATVLFNEAFSVDSIWKWKFRRPFTLGYVRLTW